MDRTVVYTESKDDRIIRFVANVPFEIIPKGFVMALRNKDFSVLEFYSKCKDYDKSEYFWNIVGLDKDDLPVVVIWGMFDKLEKILCVTRLSIHPEWQAINNEFLKDILNAVKVYSTDIGANTVIWMSKNAKYYLRKLKGLIKQSDNIIVETIQGVW